MKYLLLFFFIAFGLQAYPEGSLVSGPSVSRSDTIEGSVDFSYSELDNEIVCIKESKSTSTSFYEIYYYVNNNKCIYILLRTRKMIWDEETDSWKQNDSGCVWEENIIESNFCDDGKKKKIAKSIFSNIDMDKKFTFAFNVIKKMKKRK